MEEFNNNYVEVFPSPLTLLPTNNNSNYLGAKLNLRNLTNEYIIFKVYNNRNQNLVYSVKPSTSFIPPMESTSVSIKRFSKKEKISEECNDKFLLLLYITDKVINNIEEAKEAFKTKNYKEDSKQETILSINIQENNNNEQENTYNENDINEIGNDYIKGIKIYTDLNENLKKENNKINENIKEMEKLIEMVKKQNQLKNSKDASLKDYKYNVGGKAKKGISKDIIMICILLLGLIFGANLAKGYNRMFHSKNVKKINEIIINKSENFSNINLNITSEKNITDKNINVTNNETKKNETEKNITDKNISVTNNETKKNETEKININEKKDENKEKKEEKKSDNEKEKNKEKKKKEIKVIMKRRKIKRKRRKIKVIMIRKKIKMKEKR